jgi:hypothetical protein
MTTPTGRTPQLPNALFASVSRRARQLGRGDGGDDLFLLALLDLPEDVLARRILEAEGADVGRVLGEVRRPEAVATDATRGFAFPPAYNEMFGRAQGFAATLGDGTITPEHVLLSLIWDPTSLASQVLWRLGIPRERLLERLRAAGVAVPQAALPEQREVEIGERVWFDREQTGRVLEYLRAHVPQDVQWGFNYENERGWVMGETRVDMQRLVSEALASRSTSSDETSAGPSPVH